MKVISADFVTTAVDRHGYPPPERPEVAFAGRSNVGKSSMINALSARRKLVRVSNSPGRTRTLNFFDVQLEPQPGTRSVMRFCDLPGYGFARVSHAERERWKQMIEEYLRERERLAAVVCIVDAEVGPTEDDRTLLHWVSAVGLPLLVVATKADRLTKARRAPRLREIASALGLGEGEIMAFSSKTKMGLDELWERLWKLGGAA